MTPPANYPLTLYRGDSYRWQFKLWSNTEKTIPADLSGVAVKSEIRDRSGGSVIIPLECAIESPNIIMAELSAAASIKLPRPAGVWDLKLSYPTGYVRTILAGSVVVTVNVTDSTP